jgi:hypothetical protein
VYYATSEHKSVQSGWSTTASLWLSFTCEWPIAQLISQIVNARVAIVRLGDFLAADVQPELPLIPPAPPGESASLRPMHGHWSWPAAVGEHLPFVAQRSTAQW